MKIIEKENELQKSEIRVESGEYTFKLERSAHFHNKVGDCIGYVPLCNDLVTIKLECSVDVVRVYFYRAGHFVSLVDYRDIDTVVIE